VNSSLVIGHWSFDIRHLINFPMRCPVCNREFEKAESPAVPFCSERCRTIDLGRWLGEVYSLPIVPDPDADEVPERGIAADHNGSPDEAD
jgi:endogenous inhibitor of DNA gyrase (YacG/DUF329 family)